MKRNCVLIGCLISMLIGTVAAWGQAPQRPDIEARRAAMEQRLEALQAAAQAATEASVFVDAARGIDTPNCGSQMQPCRTITQGVARARDIQSAVEKTLVNIEVGPGTYVEGVTIHLDRIRLRGAGRGVSIINSPAGYAVFAQGVQPAFIEGFTLTGLARLGTVQAWDGTVLQMMDCEIRDSRRGLYVVSGSVAFVGNTTFTNNAEGAIADAQALLYMSDVTISGQGAAGGVGVIVVDTSVASLQRTRISQNDLGLLVNGNSEVWNFRRDTVTEIAENTIGILVNSYSEIDMRATIRDNTDTGVIVEQNSLAVLARSNLHHNGTGIFLTTGSFLELVLGQVNANGTGIFFDLFSKGILRITTFSGNGTDTATDRGGAFFTEP